MNNENWLFHLNNSLKKGDKDWTTTLILSIFLGFIGADRFYLEAYLLGILKLITIGGFGIWWLIDIGLIASQKMKDGNKRFVKKNTGSTRASP